MLLFVGIAQGIQRSVTGLAMIMGPLWGGALLHQLYVMLGVMAALEVILTVSALLKGKERKGTLFKCLVVLALER